VRPIDPEGPDTQIHSEVGFDGTHLWFVWNRPNAGSTFDLWATVTTCGGEPVAGPFEVSNSTDVEIDPVVAFAEGRTLVAWTGSAPSGLDIRTRIYDSAGEAVTAPTVFSAQRNGAPVTGNATLPAAAGAGDHFVLAGSWGHDDAPAFQGFVVEIDADGTPLADAQDLDLDPERGQTFVDLALEGDMPTAVWQEDGVNTAAPVSWAGRPDTAPVFLAEPGARPTVAVGAAGIWRAWDDNAGTVWLQTPTGQTRSLDLGPGFHHSPQLATAGDTTVVLSMEMTSGIYNRLQLSRVSEAGVTQRLPLSATAAPSVYEASVALVGDQHAVVAWQEGDNPAFRALAEWVSWSADSPTR
jgi:hypothetical protein